MPIKLANNASAHLAAPLAANGTSIVLVTSETGNFPALAAGEWFPMTLSDSAGRIEIVRVTARASNLLTATRGQEGTTALAWLTSDRAEIRLTASAIQQLQADTAQVQVNVTQEATDRAAADVAQSTALTNGLAAKFDKTGGAVTGDITTYRAASPTTGGIFLGNSGARYVFYDGTNYLMPGGQLYVNGSAVWHSGNFTPASKFNVAGGALTGVLTGATASMNIGQDAGATTGSFICRASGAGDANLAGMTFYNDSYAVKLGARADGYFGLGGWSRAAWSWYSDPSGNMVAAGNVSAYSDPRLKDNVKRIEGALSIIEQLDGVRFTWNNRTKLIGRPGASDIGVLADQVEAVLPEIVGRSIEDEENDGEQWRVVAYDKLVPVLIEGIKELSAKIRVLEGK